MKSLTNLSDQQLIHLYMDGDAEALSTLVVRYKDKIYTSIYLLVKDKYLAEDIFQDVFIRIIDTIRSGRYTEEGKFLPWAMRIAHNLCVDHFRKVKRTPTIRNSDDHRESNGQERHSHADRHRREQSTCGRQRHRIDEGQHGRDDQSPGQRQRSRRRQVDGG